MNLYQNLTEPFPKEVERTLSKSGTRLTYIPISEVITRLNKVIGVDRWSFRINKCERDALDPDYIVAHVTLEALIAAGEGKNGLIRRDGIGGQKIKRTKQGEIVDLGDEFKGAVSDALKKAAQTLGIGLYLARTEEAMEADEPQAPEPTVSPEVEELWNNFVGLSKTLDADGKKSLNKFWADYGKGRPKPSRTTATAEDLEQLIGECVRISLGATEVTND